VVGTNINELLQIDSPIRLRADTLTSRLTPASILINVY